MASEATLALRKRMEKLDPQKRWKVCRWDPAARDGRGGWVGVAPVRFERMTPPDEVRFRPVVRPLRRLSLRARGLYPVARPVVAPQTLEERRKERNRRKANARRRRAEAARGRRAG